MCQFTVSIIFFTDLFIEYIYSIPFIPNHKFLLKITKIFLFLFWRSIPQYLHTIYTVYTVYCIYAVCTVLYTVFTVYT